MFLGIWTADCTPAVESGLDFPWCCLCDGNLSETMNQSLAVYQIISNFANFWSGWTCGRCSQSLMNPFVVGNWLLHSSVQQQHSRSGLKKKSGFSGQLSASRHGGNFLHHLLCWNSMGMQAGAAPGSSHWRSYYPHRFKEDTCEGNWFPRDKINRAVPVLY